MRKLKKGIMATLEKKFQTPMEKQKKIYKKLFLQRTSLLNLTLNHLINHVEELNFEYLI